jgi:hypothetical protein
MPVGYASSTNNVIGIEHTSGAPDNPRSFETYYTNRIMRYGKEGHYGYPHFPKYKNVGGAFYLEGVETSRAVCQVGEVMRGPGGGPLSQSYEGGFAVDVVNTGAWTGTWLPESRGAEAWGKMKPTKPDMRLSNAIFELREVPEMLRQRFLNNSLSDIGNYHLALQFGWKPLLKDLRDFFQTFEKAKKHVEQLLRDNGKPVRRKITLLDTAEIVENFSFETYGAFQPVLQTQYYVTVPSGRKTVWNRERWWASAQFRYWLPPVPPGRDLSNSLMAKLYGLDASPASIYRAIPWSWLLDWFTNIGTCIENMQADTVADRLASDYAYIMREKSWLVMQMAAGSFLDRNNNIVKISGTSTSEAFVKTRAVIDPFGGAFKENELSGMQLSILGALGLSRLR